MTFPIRTMLNNSTHSPENIAVEWQADCVNGAETHVDPPKKRRQSSGSILVLTLLVVSLLMILVLAFSVYVRLSLGEVIQHQHRNEARAAARLGMQLALGQLQQFSGPDQRVTARSDLFDQTSSYRPGMEAQPDKSKWTGVWDSETFHETDPTQKKFAGWLVSGIEADALTRVESITDAFTGETVQVVGTGSVAVGDEVVVEKVPVSNSNLEFAWWVGDEGVKARFDQLDPYRGSAVPEERRLASREGQRLAMELLEVDGAHLGDTAFPAGSPAFEILLEKVTDSPQVALIGAGTAEEDTYKTLAKERFHDISLHSAGVLADVKNGGLRQDLSLAFEMDYDDWVDSGFVNAHPNAEVSLYQPPGYPAGRMIAPLFWRDEFPFVVERGSVPNLDPPVPFVFDPDSEPRHKTSLTNSSTPVLRGPAWDLFRNFYRLYKSNDPDLTRFGFSADANLDSQGRAKGRAPFPALYRLGMARRYGQDPLVWDYAEIYGPSGEDYTRSVPLGRPVLPGMAPVVTRVQTAVSFFTRQVGVEAGVPQYEVDMTLDPVVTLWNPYTVPLKTGRAFGQPLVLSVKFLNFEVNVEATPPAGSRSSMKRSFGHPRNRDDMNTFIGRYAEPGSAYYPHGDPLYQVELELGARVLEPGELVVFSHPGPAKRYWRQEVVDPNSGGELVAGPQTHLPLRSGVDALTGNSGLVFTNVVAHLNNNGAFPGGRIPHSSEIRFRMDPGMELSEGLKYKVEALKQGDVEPFMTSFQAGVAELGSDWSPMYRPQDLTSGKQLTAFYDSYLKHGNSPDPVNLLSVFNPRALTFEQGTTMAMEASAFQPDADQDLVEDLWWGEGGNTTSLQGLIDMSGDNGFWGPDNRSAGTGDWNTHIPLFDLPTSPITSLGQFQHMQLSWMADEPAYVLGTSRVSPFVGFSKISQQQLNRNNMLRNWGDQRTPLRDDWTMTRVDMAWMVNDALWDGFYFSGIAPGNGFSTSGARWADHLANGTPLPNAPYRARSVEDGEAASAWFGISGNALPESPAEISGHLMVDGMFNINSTSVDAWRALFASARKVAVELGDGSWETGTGTVVKRMSTPPDGANQPWTGFRDLTDDQIDALAEAMVIQVRERGPFLSLSEFVNRRLAESADPVTVHPHMRAGALQAAIDASGINTLFTTTLEDAGLSSTRSELNTWVRDRIDGDSLVEEGVNGDVTQADLLTAIGPLLSARSDTFTIRAYGEMGDGTAKAWCEAVVQRVPEYVQSSRRKHEPADWSPHETPTGTGYDVVNPQRRFKVISFRWLNPEDV